MIIRWTGLAPREPEFPFPGSLTSTFLQLPTHPVSRRRLRSCHPSVWRTALSWGRPVFLWRRSCIETDIRGCRSSFFDQKKTPRRYRRRLQTPRRIHFYGLPPLKRPSFEACLLYSVTLRGDREAAIRASAHPLSLAPFELA